MAWSDAARKASLEIRRRRKAGLPWRRPWVTVSLSPGTAQEAQMWKENNPNQHGIKMTWGKRPKISVHPGRLATISKFIKDDYDQLTGLESVHRSTARAMRILASKLAAARKKF